MAIAVCHTKGCGNAEIPLHVPTEFEDPETGEMVKIGGVECGVCGQPITDVTGDEDAPPDEDGGGA